MIKFPPIYQTLVKSRLISEGILKEAALEFCRTTKRENETIESAADSSVPVSDTETESDWDSFTLAEGIQNTSPNDSDTSETSSASSSAEDLNAEFLAYLESDGLLNSWQISQLKCGHTRFHLGRYRIVDAIGSGGYGYVFLGRTDSDPSNVSAEESEKQRPHDVAIKTLSPTCQNDNHSVRFHREIEINRILVHPNIVHLTDAGTDGKIDYAVYEYMDGSSAFQLLRRCGQLDYRIASYVIHETAKGLFHLHQKGYLHRDLKPGNILLSKRGNVKLADLGLVVQLTSGSFQPLLGSYSDQSDINDGQKNRVAGTSDYIPPDQILSPNTPNVLWDIYSLGCTFYYLVTGLVPFPSGTAYQKMSAHLRSEAPDPKMFNPSLPWDLARLIMEMMDKDPQKRPADAEQVCLRLKPYIAQPIDLQNLLRAKKKAEFVPLPLNKNRSVPLNDDEFLAALGGSIEQNECGGTEMEEGERAVQEQLPPVPYSAEPDSETATETLDTSDSSFFSSGGSDEFLPPILSDTENRESDSPSSQDTSQNVNIELIEREIKQIGQTTALIKLIFFILIVLIILCFFIFLI